MHCPSCGQQQVSNETKFCSRCGMPLGVVSEVLAYGGYLPQLAELNQKKKSIFSRRNGLAFSLIWCLFFLFIMTPLTGMMIGGRIPGAFAVIGIFGGLIWMISSLIFLKKDLAPLPFDPRAYPPTQGQFGPQANQGYAALPGQQSVPASVYAAPKTGSWRDTNDLQPTSVVEGTTRLLNEDDR